jgi:hypothetical protein
MNRCPLALSISVLLATYNLYIRKPNACMLHEALLMSAVQYMNVPVSLQKETQ